MKRSQKPIILFDGECKFCNFWIALIQRQKAKHKFNYFPLQSKEGKSLTETYSIDSSIDSVLVITNEKVFDKSSAAFKITQVLGGFWKFALVFWLIPKPVRDWLYRIVAKNRHRFFKNRKSCDIHI